MLAGEAGCVKGGDTLKSRLSPLFLRKNAEKPVKTRDFGGFSAKCESGEKCPFSTSPGRSLRVSFRCANLPR